MGVQTLKSIKTTRDGINYLIGELKNKKNVASRAVLWRIPHNSGAEDIRLKIGRYRKRLYLIKELECQDPKSELTLDDEEFRNLLQFLNENYEPFRTGAKNYITIDQQVDERLVQSLKEVFGSPDRERLL